MGGIALFVVPIIVYALPLPATADSKQICKIKISHYVIAADPQLHPAKHGVRWDRSGPHVQVRFVDERDELVSIPATRGPDRERTGSEWASQVSRIPACESTS